MSESDRVHSCGMTKERLDNLGKYNTDGTILDLLAHIESLQAKVEDILSAISRGDYSYVESVYLDYDDDGNPPVAALKQGGTGIQDMMAEVEALSQEGE